MSLSGRWRAFLKSQNERLDVETLEVPVPRLPEALSGLRVAVVSDLHVERLSAYYDSIVSAVYTARPDVILVAGDTTDSASMNIEALDAFFMPLARLAPTFAILGNNDCDMGRVPALRGMYRKSGVALLENELATLTVRGAQLTVYGLSDPSGARRGIRPPRGEVTEDDLYFKLLPAPSLLIIHRPQHAARHAPLGPSLIVAGHAHGGQFRLPWIGGLYAPGQGVFPRLTSGLYSVDGARLLVSRGLGNHGFPFRLGNRPHIPIAVLRPM